MVPPSHDRGRLVTTQTPSKLSITTDRSTLAIATPFVRCTRCRHQLTAEKSVAIELGPVCRREVAA